MHSTIRTAYAYSPKTRTYRARAFVLECNHPGLPASHSFKHSSAIAIGDSAEEATAEAIRYVRDMHARDGVAAPLTVERVGRLSGVLVDAALF